MNIRGGMEEGEFHCNLGEEVRGLNISIGNEEIEYNVHREIIELAKLVETMRSLRMEVQSYRECNERLIRAQERENELNDQLVQSLNQLQRERKKESGSRHDNENIPHPIRDS